jgi:hypothetical protein
MGTQWNVIGRYDGERDAKRFAKDNNTREILVSPSRATEDLRLL